MTLKSGQMFKVCSFYPQENIEFLLVTHDKIWKFWIQIWSQRPQNEAQEGKQTIDKVKNVGHQATTK